MIRTLLLLSFTLIFLLAYAVYGATSNSGYYVYESEKDSNNSVRIMLGFCLIAARMFTGKIQPVSNFVVEFQTRLTPS